MWCQENKSREVNEAATLRKVGDNKHSSTVHPIGRNPQQAKVKTALKPHRQPPGQSASQFEKPCALPIRGLAAMAAAAGMVILGDLEIKLS